MLAGINMRFKVKIELCTYSYSWYILLHFDINVRRLNNQFLRYGALKLRLWTILGWFQTLPVCFSCIPLQCSPKYSKFQNPSHTYQNSSFHVKSDCDTYLKYRLMELETIDSQDNHFLLMSKFVKIVFHLWYVFHLQNQYSFSLSQLWSCFFDLVPIILNHFLHCFHCIIKPQNTTNLVANLFLLLLVRTGPTYDSL